MTLGNRLTLGGQLRHFELDSSALRSGSYDDATHVLEVVMMSGSIYRYMSVPPSTVDALITSSSHGRFYNEHIRDTFRFERIR